MAEATSTGATTSARLMVVEDSSVQLGILSRMLAEQGYDVRPFRDGLEALEAAASEAPDLVLLDINMPGINGYELCRRLQRIPGLEAVPVIFISAKYEVSDKTEAFACGGVDYMTKPYQIEEVRARVETHLNVSLMRRQLEEHNRRLEVQVAERTRELAEASERLALLDRAKSDFLKLISHELRTPLNGVLGIAGVILRSCADQPAVERLGASFRDAQHNLLSLVDDALLLTQINVVDLGVASQAMDLGEIVAEAVGTVRELSRARVAGVDAELSGGGAVRGDRALLVRALCAVLETAVRLTSTEARVRCSIEGEAGAERVVVLASGHVIPDDALPRLFDPFSVSEAIAPGGDLGLRLVVAREILALFDGTVEVENLDPPGVRFGIVLQR